MDPLVLGFAVAAGSVYIEHRLKEVARQYRINLNKAFEDLSDKHKVILLDAVIERLEESYSSGSETYREWLEEFMSPAECPACKGRRLRASSLAVLVKNFSIAEFTSLPVSRALMTVRNWEFEDREMQIAARVLDEIRRRLEFLSEVGLDYLSLDRSAATLSGGEAQRIRLATQIGSKLRGVLYVLDEPSIGLHPRDNCRLLETLAKLRDMGNTVLVVEHDAETIERADYVSISGRGRDGSAASW
jgi:excinuclease ABC subunit A